MNTLKFIIRGLLILLSVLLFALYAMDEYTLPFVVRAVLFPLLTLLYVIQGSKTKSFFFYFLLTFSISELFGGFDYLAYESDDINDLMYYGRNSLYILSYIFLCIEIFNTLNYKILLKRFIPHIVIMLGLTFYIVNYMTHVTLDSSNYGEAKFYDYFVVVPYYSVIMLLLSIALISYLNNESRKGMNLFIGAVCVVFSEIIQTASFYISSQVILDISHTAFILLAFYFFYIQADMEHSRFAD